jgi:acyl-CoA thioester hydrolase
MEKILKSFRKIRFQDCDPFNHLNNSKYIDYFINAREDQILENYGLDIFSIAEKQGLSWVVASHQINYLKPAFLMETVLIESLLLKYSSKSLLVEMSMWDENHQVLKSVLWTYFIHFNLRSQKPEQHSKELTGLFETVVQPGVYTSLTERITFLSGHKG